jgi:hypothetical protein
VLAAGTQGHLPPVVASKKCGGVNLGFVRDNKNRAKNQTLKSLETQKMVKYTWILKGKKMEKMGSVTESQPLNFCHR